MKISPITHAAAKSFIAKHHRHNRPSIACVFTLGLVSGDELVGVAMVGRPKSRMLDDGATLEVTRVCVVDGAKNANSKLYASAARIARELGYSRMFTYTLPEESGVSLCAAGWTREGDTFGDNPDGWKRNRGHGADDLFGERRLPSGPKTRWRKDLA